MLEVTVHRADGGLGTFQFENDALQAFLTENPNDAAFTVTELRALGGNTLVVAKGGVPAKRDTLGIRTPIQETARAKAAQSDANEGIVNKPAKDTK